MISPWRGRLLKVVLGVYLIAMGFMAGVAFERIRFDAERKAVLDRYNEMVHKSRANQIEIERREAPPR